MEVSLGESRSLGWGKSWFRQSKIVVLQLLGYQGDGKSAAINGVS